MLVRAYIISVNASILADSGGTCVCNDANDPTCATEQAYNLCLLGKWKSCETSAISNQLNELTTEADLKRDLITATAAISGLSSFVFGFMTNLPVALA